MNVSCEQCAVFWKVECGMFLMILLVSDNPFSEKCVDSINKTSPNANYDPLLLPLADDREWVFNRSSRLGNLMYHQSLTGISVVHITLTLRIYL
jgi:hypothetical protein